MKIVGCLLPLIPLALIVAYVCPGGGPISAPEPPRATADFDPDLRFAFINVIAGAAGAPDQAEFLLCKRSKRFVQPDGSVGWLRVSCMVRVNDTLLGECILVPPGSRDGNKVAIGITTPYVLVAIHPDVQHTVYYEIRTVRREASGKDKNLEVMARSLPVEVAVLKNTRTGALLEVPRLLPPIRRPGRFNVIYYPIIPGDTYSEVEQFIDHPADFVPSPLTPPFPIRHASDEGPLEVLREQTGDDLMKTDTDYWELPDGRVVWWENLNHKLRVYPER